MWHTLHLQKKALHSIPPQSLAPTLFLVFFFFFLSKFLESPGENVDTDVPFRVEHSQAAVASTVTIVSFYIY